MMIRKKARILVHPEYAATLVGTPDQTGLLQAGEVFLQVGTCVIKTSSCTASCSDGILCRCHTMHGFGSRMHCTVMRVMLELAPA
jgi:hypothetical protein